MSKSIGVKKTKASAKIPQFNLAKLHAKANPLTFKLEVYDQKLSKALAMENNLQNNLKLVQDTDCPDRCQTGLSQYDKQTTRESLERLCSRRTCNKDKHKGISSMDNNDIREYTSWVYQHYKIKDPLGELSSNRPGQKATQKKDKGRRQSGIGRQTTARVRKGVSVKLQQNHLNFHSPQPRKTVITLRPKSHLGQVQETKSSKSSIQITQRNNQRVKTYRYCFMCEEAVKNRLLEQHEEECQQLKSALSLSYNQLTIIAQQKVKRMKMALQQSLEQEELNSQQSLPFDRALQQWLSSAQVCSQRIRLFQKLQRIGERRVLNFDLCRRLRWFMQIQERMRELMLDRQ